MVVIVAVVVVVVVVVALSANADALLSELQSEAARAVVRWI